MTRIALVSVALLLGFALLANGRRAAAAEQPNIVLILIDDLGWMDLGCYGNEFHETPRIDQLAAEGMRFTDFYAACPVCSPTRVSIQAGQYQTRVQLTDFIPGHWRPFEKLVVPHNASNLPLSVTTPAEALKTAGYTSGYFGKWHLGDERHSPGEQGYDDWIETRGRHFAPNFRTTPPVEDIPDGTPLADFLTDQTVRFIEENAEGPFFVQLSHYAVHIPLEAEEEAIEKYQEKPKPQRGVNHPVYAAMHDMIDRSVGRVVDALARLDLSDDTLVIFTSDNGGLHFGRDGSGEQVTSNEPLRGEKGTVYEGGIRVPLIAKWPGVIPPGRVCDEPAISIDFLPTFLDAAKVSQEPAQVIDGLSLVPLFEDPDARLDREAIYFHYPHYHHMEPAGAMRMGDWKLIELFSNDTVELYNLAHDIGETKNLAELEPHRAKMMRRKLAAWREEVGALMPMRNQKYDPERAHEWWSRRTGRPLEGEE